MPMLVCTSTGLPWKVPGLKRHLVAMVLMADSSKPYPNPVMILKLPGIPSLRTMNWMRTIPLMRASRAWSESFAAFLISWGRGA